MKQNHDCACGGDLGTQLCFLLECHLNGIIGLVLEAAAGQPRPRLHHLSVESYGTLWLYLQEYPCGQPL